MSALGTPHPTLEVSRESLVSMAESLQRTLHALHDARHARHPAVREEAWVITDSGLRVVIGAFAAMLGEERAS